MRSPIPVFLVAEYLETESKSELCHEYLGGQILAIAALFDKVHCAINFLISGEARGSTIHNHAAPMKRPVNFFNL
jgi:hypothetical protein